LPDLRKRFPTENPQQILDRLTKMWDLHVRQIAFGIKCRDTCDCAAGWKNVFFEGDVDSAEAALRSKKKQKKRSFSEQSDDVSAIYEVPLKRKTSTKLAPTQVIKQEDSMLASYSVSFDVRQPLGFYCTTEQNEGKNACVIRSIHPAGQCRMKDQRVDEGTFGKCISNSIAFF
jgi:hypothetical protein